jgi:S-adenosylmethionine hydrolase
MTVSLPPPSAVVTLLTDFGLRDPYVGIMKGAMLRRAAGLLLVDVSHDVAPQDLDEATFFLEQSYRWFPPGTVHLVVIDPGVGTARRAVAVCAEGHYFVAPDNGVLSGVLAREHTARALDSRVLGPEPASRTFHGRDIFGPAAACLAASLLGFNELGSPCTELEKNERVPPRWQGGSLVARVVSVDRFGNLITNAPRSRLSTSRPTVELAGRSFPLVGTYEDLEPGQCAALIVSYDTVEIACRNGSAARELDAARGDEVRITPAAPPR